MTINGVDVRVVVGRPEGFAGKTAAPFPVLTSVDEHRVRRCCAEALRALSASGAASGALTGIGPDGMGDFPLTAAAKILAQEILKCARFSPGALKDLVLVASDEHVRGIFDRQVIGYLRHICEDLGQGPYITVDIIIERPEGLVLIERSNPPFGWALPGGFVDYGETLEQAAAREAREETHLDVQGLRLFRTCSDPARDPRFHTVSIVFIAEGLGEPRSGDDAKNLKVIPYAELVHQPCAFDHSRVIADYLAQRGKGDRR